MNHALPQRAPQSYQVILVNSPECPILGTSSNVI